MRTNRLNTDPPVLRGCSGNELAAIAAGAGGGSFVLFMLTVAPFWGFTAALACTWIVGGLLGYVAASMLQGMKRARPDGYYQQRWRLWLEDRQLAKPSVIRRAGPWGIGRTDRSQGT